MNHFLSYLLFLNLFLLSHECNQVFSGHRHLLGLCAVRRRLRGVRVLLTFVLIDTFFPPFSSPLPPAPASFLLPARI